jgi:aspartate racemase
MAENRPESRWIGLIGGLGVGATVYYYERLVKQCESRGSAPRLLMAHADVNTVYQAALKRDLAGMADYLAGLVRRMAQGGAELAAVPAVAPHMCFRELAERSPIPLVNIIEETGRELRRRGLRRVALLGARFVLESRMYGQLGDIEVVMPSAEEITAIHEAYFQVAGSGVSNDQQYQTMHDMAHKLLDRGAEAIVLAGTDLAVIFNEGNIDFPYVDCAQVHIEALVAQATGRASADPA